MLPSALSALSREALGVEPDTFEKLKGDASEREIYRLHAGSTTLIGICNPHAPAENAAFVAFSRRFRRWGLPVPAIVAADLGAGVYLEQDLGDITLLSWLDAHGTDRWTTEAQVMYRRVLEYLPIFQIAAGPSLDYALCYQGSEFDTAAMMRDLRYFEREFLDPFVPAHPDVGSDFDQLVDVLGRYSRDFFMYRDFQARNVMIVGNQPWFLDYQSGRRGPLPYDVASLLFDGAVQIPEQVRYDLLAGYLDTASTLHAIDREVFLGVFPGFALLRALQALGAYGFLSRQKGKRHFLVRVPTALQNLAWLSRNWSPRLPEIPSLWRAVDMLRQQPHLGHLA